MTDTHQGQQRPLPAAAGSRERPVLPTGALERTGRLALLPLRHAARTAASRPERVEAGSIALRALSLRCRDAYRPLTEAAGIAHMIRDTGWLSVYRTEASFAAAEEEFALQRRRGVVR